MPSLPEDRRLHGEMLELLKRFDALCAASGVRYTLDAGTLLGAIREKGFIPWDDDVDIALSRADYEKLRDACNRGPMPQDLYFYEFTAQRPHIWLKRPGEPEVGLDLFIYDYITERPALAKLRLLGCAFFLVFTKNRNSLEISRKAGLHRGAKERLMTLGYWLGRPFSAKAKARMQNFYLKHAFHGRRTRIHRGNDNYDYIDRILPAGILDAYERVPFEDAELLVTARAREVLRSTFGPDYMTPVRWAGHDNPALAAFIGPEEERE